MVILQFSQTPRKNFRNIQINVVHCFASINASQKFASNFYYTVVETIHQYKLRNVKVANQQLQDFKNQLF